MTKHPARDARVFLYHLPSYDVDRIRELVRGVMTELDLRPRGRTLVKPNLVMAGEMCLHAFTRPEIVEGVLGALSDRDAGEVTEMAVGERSAITVPTRFSYKEAGYDGVFERTGAKRYCFEEVPQLEVRYTHEHRLRDYVFIPEPVVKADFFVNCPKLKAHPWTTVTFAMKNYIGIQDDRHRLIDHDHALNRKLADLQYVIQPQLIVIDGVIAGEGRMLTPMPRNMNLLIIGNNQVAIDAVTCAIVGVDPRGVDHIRFAYERGFGPIDLPEIRVEGDVSLEEAKERGRGFKIGLIRVEKYFEGTSIQAYAGRPPSGPKGDDYCWGGCPGVMEEVIEILRVADEQCDRKLPRIHMVFGDYKGELDVSYGEKVIFVGDCVSWEGQLGGELVKIRSKYKDRAELDPHEASHKDVYERMARMALRLREAREKPYVHVEGCPVSIGELVFLIAELGGLKNPYFDRRALYFNQAYLGWRGKTILARLKGEPYQVKGEAAHGEARPRDLAPPAADGAE